MSRRGTKNPVVKTHKKSLNLSLFWSKGWGTLHNEGSTTYNKNHLALNHKVNYSLEQTLFWGDKIVGSVGVLKSGKQF